MVAEVVVIDVSVGVDIDVIVISLEFTLTVSYSGDMSPCTPSDLFTDPFVAEVDSNANSFAVVMTAVEFSIETTLEGFSR